MCLQGFVIDVGDVTVGVWERSRFEYMLSCWIWTLFEFLNF